MTTSRILFCVVITAACGCAPDASQTVDREVKDQPIETQESVETGHQECDVLTKELWTSPDTKSGSATSASLLYYPRITKLKGRVVKRNTLAKRYAYYVVTNDGHTYALDIHSPPDSGIDLSYDVVGVRLEATPEHREKLERDARSTLLPGQTLPKSRIDAVLFDVALTVIHDEVVPPAHGVK